MDRCKLLWEKKVRYALLETLCPPYTSCLCSVLFVVCKIEIIFGSVIQCNVLLICQRYMCMITFKLFLDLLLFRFLLRMKRLKNSAVLQIMFIRNYIFIRSAIHYYLWCFINEKIEFEQEEERPHENW